MPKPHTFPTLFDDLLHLNISDFKKFGYLKMNECKTGVLTWSKNEVKTNSISVYLNTIDNPYLELSYSNNENNYKYKIFFETSLSNLGKGIIWYFVCPRTGKRCRKLYLNKGIFVNREAIVGAMYESQTKTKEWRFIDKTFGAYFNEEKCFSKIGSKHFKKYYKGKPTKRYLKLLEVIEKAKAISYADIEMAMMFGVKGLY